MVKAASVLVVAAMASEKVMAPHSSTLAWKIPRMEEPGTLRSMGSQQVRHDWATSLWLFTFMHWRRKWQPTPVFLPGESQGQWSLVGCRLWGCTESDTTEATWQQQLLACCKHHPRCCRANKGEWVIVLTFKAQKTERYQCYNSTQAAIRAPTGMQSATGSTQEGESLCNLSGGSLRWWVIFWQVKEEKQGTNQ